MPVCLSSMQVLLVKSSPCSSMDLRLSSINHQQQAQRHRFKVRMSLCLLFQQKRISTKQKMKDEKGKEIALENWLLSVRTHCAKSPLSRPCRPQLTNPCSTIEGVCCLYTDAYFCYNRKKQAKQSKAKQTNKQIQACAFKVHQKP